MKEDFEGWMAYRKHQWRQLRKCKKEERAVTLRGARSGTFDTNAAFGASSAKAAATAAATTTVLALVAGLIAALRMKCMSAERRSGSSEGVANTTKADKNGTIKTSFESVKNAPENRKIKTSKKKKKRLEKQRAKQRDSHATSSTSTSTGRGSIASMAIAMIWFLAALLAVLTQLGSVSFRSFPWSGILLFLLAEMSSESNQVRSCI